MVLTESPDRRARREFGETSCSVCGRTKPAGHSFCAKCFYALPHGMRGALYRLMGEGYEAAHSAARDFLLEEHRAAS